MKSPTLDAELSVKLRIFVSPRMVRAYLALAVLAQGHENFVSALADVRPQPRHIDRGVGIFWYPPYSPSQAEACSG